jgi:hypothetical protein
MDFLSSLCPPQDMAVTYFDEAHNLDILYWILLRLLHNQPQSTNMWYTFMGTKSHITYYAPRPANSQFLPYFMTVTYSETVLSLRLKEEIAELSPPYIALGFDQQVIVKKRTQKVPEVVCMGDLRKIETLCQYGRPM